MWNVIKRNGMTIESPDTPGFKREVPEYDFRNTILDFPMTIPPDELAILVDHYRTGNRINYGQFVSDLLACGNPAPSPMKITKPNPKYLALARYLHDGQTDLQTLVGFMDKTGNGILTADNFARALSNFPLAKDVARLAMNLKTREVDYRKLQQTLDQIELNLPKEEPIPETHEVPEILQEFTRLIHEKQIRLRDYFAPESKTVTTLMTEEKFMGILTSLGLPMDTEKLEQITEMFGLNGGFVDYVEFLNQVHAHEHNDYEPVKPVIDGEALAETLVQLFIARKFNVWRMFKPYDRKNTGLVPKAVFLKALTSHQLDMSEADITAAIDALADEDGNINYVDFGKRVYAHKNIDFDKTVESVIENLKTIVEGKTPTLHRYLEIYDREKSGRVQVSQFVAGLRRMGYEIPEHDLTLIRGAYEDPQNPHLLLWEDICKDIYGEIEVISTPRRTVTPASPSMREVLNTSAKATPLYSTEELAITSPRKPIQVPDHLIPLYGQIKQALENFGFDLSGELLSHDKFKKGVVARNIFKQTIDLLPLAIDPTLLDELTLIYVHEDPTLIHYASFLKDVNDFSRTCPSPRTIPRHNDEEEESTEPTVTRAMRLTQSISNMPEDVTSIVLRLRCFAHEHMLNISEFFKHWDKLNSGTVQIGDLNRVFGPTGIYIAPAELDALAAFFKCEDKPERFNYLALCRAIEDEEAIASNEDAGIVPLSQSEEERCSYIVHRLGEYIRMKRCTCARLFSGQKEPRIPAEEMYRLLCDVAKLVIKGDEWRLIMRKYKANMRGDMDWRRFCKDADHSLIPL